MDTISVLLISAVGVCLVAIIGMLIWSWRHRPTEAERQAARMAALDRVISDDIPQRPPYPQGVRYPPFEDSIQQGPPLQYSAPQYESPGWQQGPPARPQGITLGYTEYVMPSNVVIEEPAVVIENPQQYVVGGDSQDLTSCTSVAADGTETTGPCYDSPTDNVSSDNQ